MRGRSRFALGSLGIETLEWVALAAGIMALLVGAMAVFTPGGRQVATEMCGEGAT